MNAVVSRTQIVEFISGASTRDKERCINAGFANCVDDIQRSYSGHRMENVDVKITNFSEGYRECAYVTVWCEIVKNEKPTS